MKIGELLFELGFKADTMKLKDFGRAVSELNMSSIISAGSFGLMYEGAKDLLRIAQDATLSLNKFGRETGQSREEIQQWNNTASQAGISAGTIASSVAHLQDSLFRMNFTGESSNIWNMLGLDPRHTKDMFEVLTMIRNRIKGLTTEQQRFFLENLGLSTELLNMFKLTDEQWRDIPNQQKNSLDQLDKMATFYASQAKLSADIQTAWVDIASSIIPIADKLVQMADSMTIIARGSEDFKNAFGFLGKLADGTGKMLQQSAQGWGYIANLSTTGDIYGGRSSGFSNMLALLNDKALTPADYARSDISKAVTVNAPITIHSNDPDATGKAVQKHLDKHIDDAINSSPSGGR